MRSANETTWRGAIVAAVAVAAVGAPAAEGRAPGGLDEIRLTSLSGKRFTLASFAGKVVVVHVWASWCKSCEKELPVLDALAARCRAAKKAVVIVAVSVDRNEASAKRTVAAAKLTSLRVAFDPDDAIATRFDLDRMPTSLVFDRAGAVRHTQRGYKPGDEAKLARAIDAALDH